MTDLRLAWRSLRRTPGFTAVVVASLSLGIGATTAMFSVVNGVLLRPLPFPDPERIVAIYTRFLPSTGYDFPFFSVSGPEYEDLREVRAFGSLAGYVWDTANLAGAGGVPERVPRMRATAELFPVLGVQPALGRGFAPGDADPGAPCVAVLADGLWRRAFAADPGLLGRDVLVDAAPCRVVGVMPPGVAFPDAGVGLWTPLALDRGAPTWARGSHTLQVVGRLAPGVTAAEADAELARLRARWAEVDPEHHAAGHFAVALPLRDDLFGESRTPLTVLLGAVTFVLLIVCVNLAHLVLSRAESRRRELALRSALGASPARLLRQLLTESLLLAVAGAAAGLALAGGILAALASLDTTAIPRLDEVRLDLRVLLFASALSLLTGLGVGALPALRASRTNAAEALAGSARVRGGRSSTRFRRGLAVAEVALSLVLVAGATLLVRSYGELQRVELGFDPRGVLTFGLDVPVGAQPDAAGARELLLDVRRRLEREPGVAAVGAISDLPLASPGAPDDFLIEGRPPPASGEPGWNARYLMVSPGALETLRVPLVAGRLLDDGDAAGRPLVALVNRTAARAYWPGEDPLGRRIRYYAEGAPWITIVGVVGDVRSIEPAAPPPPAVYVPLAQAPRPAYSGRFTNFVVRGTHEPAELLPAARRVVSELDPTLPLADVRTLEAIVGAATGRLRFTTTLMTSFAVVGLLLAALGVYGVLAHAVQRRIPEIGLRMAVGASRGAVLRLVLIEGLGLAAVGIALGTAGALALTRSLSSLLFGVRAGDPAHVGLAVATVVAACVVAASLPARRAARLDPRILLLQE